jgi:hypothetical protein
MKPNQIRETSAVLRKCYALREGIMEFRIHPDYDFFRSFFLAVVPNGMTSNRNNVPINIRNMAPFMNQRLDQFCVVLIGTSRTT